MAEEQKYGWFYDEELMRSGYYPSDMGMEGGAMYKKGGPVKRKVNFQIIQVMVKLLKKIS